MTDKNGLYEGTYYGYGDAYDDGSHDGVDCTYATSAEAIEDAGDSSKRSGKKYIFKVELIATVEAGDPKVTWVKPKPARKPTVKRTKRRG